MAPSSLLRSHTPNSIESARLAISLNVGAAPVRGFLPREYSPSCDLCRLTVGWDLFERTQVICHAAQFHEQSVASYYFFCQAAVRLTPLSCCRLLSTWRFLLLFCFFLVSQIRYLYYPYDFICVPWLASKITVSEPFYVHVINDKMLIIYKPCSYSLILYVKDIKSKPNCTITKIRTKYLTWLVRFDCEPSKHRQHRTKSDKNLIKNGYDEIVAGADCKIQQICRNS